MSAIVLRTGGATLHALSAASAAHLHAHALKLGLLPSYLHLCSALLKTYAVSGRIAAARQLFDETPRRDVPLWNALVSAYARSGHPRDAIAAASAMARDVEGFRPNRVSITSLLSACAQLRSSVLGRELHGYATRNVPVLDLPVLNALVNMYGKCGRLRDARMVFAGMRVGMRSAVSWTSMINACCENGRPAEALEVFEQMRIARVKVDEVTLLAVISACTKLDCTSGLGDWVEACTVESGFLQNTRVAYALIHMHGKMGRVKRSCGIFDSMGAVKTVVSWTAMVQALAMNGHGVASGGPRILT
jgi:pentatricopeptide repeat protein